MDKITFQINSQLIKKIFRKCNHKIEILIDNL